RDDRCVYLHHRDALAVEFDDPVQAGRVELEPPADVVICAAAASQREAVRRDRAQEYPAQPEPGVGVDDLARPIEACLRSRHQRADPIGAEPLLHLPDAGDCLLPAVAAGTTPVAVVQVLRTVKRGRDVDLFLSAEAEDLLIE